MALVTVTILNLSDFPLLDILLIIRSKRLNSRGGLDIASIYLQRGLPFF
jgi:hypothetical protein